MYTPFCICLASGTLHNPTFIHFMQQDFHFLKAFDRAYEFAAECAENINAKQCINELREAVTIELESLASYLKKSVVEDRKKTAVTVKFTEFLLAIASGRIEGAKGVGNLVIPFERQKLAAYILGAMAPRMRLYAYAATKFKEALGADLGDHIYKGWINIYSSKIFEEEAVERPEDMLEKLSATLNSGELDTIEKLYHQAMKLELEFFCSQPVSQEMVVPLIKDHNPAENQLVVVFSDSDLFPSTSVDASTLPSLDEGPKSIDSQFFLDASLNLDVGVHILSHYLGAKQTRSYPRSGGPDFQDDDCSKSISSFGSAKSLGYTCEKLEAFKKILEKYGNNRNKFTVVYIGGSIDDLHCLLEADIGIVCTCRSYSSLKRLATRFGVSFLQLYPSVVRKQKGLIEVEDTWRSWNWKGLQMPAVFYTLGSWAEIRAFILGC